MKKRILALLVFSIIASAVRADEGMWLLPLIKQLNMKDMKAEGLKLSAEDIYNINGNSLKDAIVIFGGGCTGEIVSAEGLLLTNHHCGYGAIQKHSSVEHDYLKNGFWAMSREEEIPTPGLAVTFVRRIVDVTDQIIPHLSDAMTEKERDDKIANELSKPIIEAAIDKSRSQSGIIRDMFGGNQYFLFVMERYEDVRMVGAPPSSIGKFGGDTDNWMWPRHTGDFSVFRVYADKDGKPAKYSKDNIPYKSPTHLKVSLKGIQSGDFAMIMGFPGTTQRYMTSYEIGRMLDVDNPVRIFIRGERQAILMADMKASDKIRIQYASKYASSSNYWKNSIGMSQSLKKLNIKAQKQALESQLNEWLAANPDKQAKYGQALPLIKKSVDESLKDRKVSQYFNEALLRGVELIMLSNNVRMLQSVDSAQFQAVLGRVRQVLAEQYKDYSPSTDRKVAYRMVQIIVDSIDKTDYPSFVSAIQNEFKGDVKAYVDYVFDNSAFATQQKCEAFLASPSREAIAADPGVILAKSVIEAYNAHIPSLQEAAADFEKGHRLFIAGLMEMMPGHKFYPDANSTMRMTYGQVLPYDPADGITYHYYTTLSGVIAKEDPKNAYKFTVPDKLKELYAAKDFGRYAYKGDVPVAFLSNNDITGGNSGSPVMNNRGELIGLAFDGNWEALSGDITFEPLLQRTISVDIRYVLFIMDKFAGASHLVNEMTIVK